MTNEEKIALAHRAEAKAKGAADAGLDGAEAICRKLADVREKAARALTVGREAADKARQATEALAHHTAQAEACIELLAEHLAQAKKPAAKKAAPGRVKREG